MKTEIPASIMASPKPAKARRLLPALLCCLGLLTILAILLNWQVQLPVCPARAIRVLDHSGVPLQGVRVVEQWGLSVLQQGEIQTTTDHDGWAAFDPVTVPMSMLRRLQIIVQPSARGLGYENYGTPRFRVFLPEGFTAQTTPRPFPTSAPVPVPNAQGVAIHEFRPYSNRLSWPRDASQPGKDLELKRPAPCFLNVVFPPDRDSFELRITKQRMDEAP